MSRDPSSSDAAPKKPFGARVSGAANDVGDFWTRVTNGLAIDQLWRQFRSEASEGYGLYSREVDWGRDAAEERHQAILSLGLGALSSNADETFARAAHSDVARGRIIFLSGDRDFPAA